MEKALWIGLIFARIHTAWAAVATRLDGTFAPASWRWWRSKTARVEATIGTASVLMDYYTVSHGNSSTTYSRTRVATSCSKRLTIRSMLARSVGKGSPQRETQSTCSMATRSCDSAVMAASLGMRRIRRSTLRWSAKLAGSKSPAAFGSLRSQLLRRQSCRSNRPR